MKDLILSYIKSFKIFFPTWIICIFFFSWENIACAIIGIVLLILQSIQIYFCKKKYVLLSDFENEKVRIMEDAETEKRSLLCQIEEKEKQVECFKDKFEEASKSINEKVLKAREDEKTKTSNYVVELQQQISILNEKLEIQHRRGEFVGYAGHYRVGNDIDTGSYLVVPCGGKDAYVELYPSYAKFKKEDDAIVCTSASTEYRVALPENGAYLVVENGDIYRSLPIKSIDGRSDFLGSYDIPILEED